VNWTFVGIVVSSLVDALDANECRAELVNRHLARPYPGLNRATTE
jgi:hypothetical protein